MAQYIPFEMTERMKKVKDTYMTLTVPKEKDPYTVKKYRPYCSGDRFITFGYLRGYEKYKDAPTVRLRHSYAEAQELYEAKVQIFDDELLLGHLYLPEYSTEEQKEYESLCQCFEMSSSTLCYRTARRDHITLDFDKLLRVGINGLREEIKEQMSLLDMSQADPYPDFEVLKKKEFYECCLIELDAVSDLARRYSQTAFEMSESKDEPRKSELVKLSQILKKVPDEPAETFYEAIQSVQFFLSTLFGLFPLGRPDRYLYTYYKNDIENGSLTKEFAQELVDNFCLYVSDRVFSRAACGFIVGGRDENGNNVENDLTRMFITALHHLKLPDPNGALAVNKDTSDELLLYCAKVLSDGTSHPAFYNDDVIINSLVDNYNVEYGDAVNYIHSTCAEITVAGKSKGHSTSFVVNLPAVLLDCVKTVSDDVSFEKLVSSFFDRVKENIKEQNIEYNYRILEASRCGNDAMRICTLVDDCIKRGKSVYEGGEKYTFLQPVYIGFSTVADSFTAIKNLVYKDKKLTLKKFYSIVDNNYKDDERLRQYIIHKVLHYGNDNSDADSIAQMLSSGLLSMFESDKLLMSHYLMPGTFSYVSHAYLGEKTKATFDGRLAYTSFSDGCSAVQGRDTNGPTAMILSLTSWNQSKLLGGMVVNIKFNKNNLDGEKAKSFVTLLRTFVERGGIEMQVNVVDRKTLEDAMIHPENHENLLVRIGGYSDYFTRIKPSLQQEIIQRTQY